MKEIYKPIKNYEDKYEVSNLGNVRNLYWQVYTSLSGDYKNGEREYVKSKPRYKKLKGWCNENGYRRVSLAQDGKYKAFYVHRLVADAFIDNPKNLPCVHHIDNVSDNNVVENLMWVTRRENTRYYWNKI